MVKYTQLNQYVAFSFSFFFSRALLRLFPSFPPFSFPFDVSLPVLGVYDARAPRSLYSFLILLVYTLRRTQNNQKLNKKLSTLSNLCRKLQTQNKSLKNDLEKEGITPSPVEYAPETPPTYQSYSFIFPPSSDCETSQHFTFDDT